MLGLDNVKILSIILSVKQEPNKQKGKEMANRKKIYPETWVFAGSAIIGALIIALGMRGCKGCSDCNDQPIYGSKAKADSVVVNKSTVTINGNNNVVNINQNINTGAHSVINNTTCPKPAVKKTQPKAKPQPQVTHDTVYIASKPVDTKTQVANADVIIVDCYGTLTKKQQKVFYRNVNGQTVIDSIVDVKVVADTLVHKIDTCRCARNDSLNVKQR